MRGFSVVLAMAFEWRDSAEAVCRGDGPANGFIFKVLRGLVMTMEHWLNTQGPFFSSRVPCHWLHVHVAEGTDLAH